MENKIMTSAENDLIEEILKYQRENNLYDYPLCEVIIDFCQENNYDEEELGETIRHNKDFVRLLAEDCINNNILKGLKKKDPSASLSDF